MPARLKPQGRRCASAVTITSGGLRFAQYQGSL